MDSAPNCTRSLFGDRCVAQPRFQVGDVAVCEACATFAVTGLGEPVVTTPLKPFACGIATLAASGLCADVFAATAPNTTCAPAAGEAALQKAVDQQRAAPAPNAAKIEGVLQRCRATRAAHEDAALLNDVRGLLPLDLLRARARARSDPIPDGDDKAAAFAAATAKHYGSASSEASDALLGELATYFKGPQFFTWVKKPPCPRCGGGTTGAGPGTPNEEERRKLANRVELYRCQCGGEARFPRYNCPRTLLFESRTGRCGEFANAFVPCLRACGFEARYVWDSTDHVWAEAWSAAQARWLHVDPCERAVDRPRMYERGWGKKLACILAFGRDEVVDVTRRYTRDIGACLSRRTEDHGWHTVPEYCVAASVAAADALARSLAVDDAWARSRDARRAAEARELIDACWAVDAGEATVGRTSGDAKWIRSRGEGGGLLPGGSWANSAEDPRATEEGRSIRLEAKLRACDGSLKDATVTFGAGERFGNSDGRFEREEGCDVVGALNALRRRSAIPSLAELAAVLRSDAVACLSSAEDVAECRRRHVRILENLKDRGLEDERVRRLKVENAIVLKFILAPVHAAVPWLYAAAGFDAAEVDGESGAAASLVAPAPPWRVLAAMAALEEGWPN